MLVDASPSVEDGLIFAKVEIRRREIAKALVVLVVIIIGGEGLDLALQIPGQKVVL